jgi:hypothetical protein
MPRSSLSRPSFCLKHSSQHSVPIKYRACSTALQYHTMYILTHFNLPYRTCRNTLTNYSLNSQHKVCNWTVRSLGHEQIFFKAIRPGLAYSIKIKPRRNDSQTKYIFTNSLKKLLVSTRFKYLSSVCVLKRKWNLKLTDYQNSSKSANNICSFSRMFIW